MAQLVLNGEVDNRDSLIDALTEDNRRLKQELADARGQLAQASRTNAQAVGALRQQLSPLYRALQAVFGEIDAIGVVDDSPASTPRVNAAWEAWKKRLGGQKAKCIDAFLTHGALTKTQLRVIIGCANGSIPGLISELKSIGLINKSGGKYSLKEL